MLQPQIRSETNSRLINHSHTNKYDKYSIGHGTSRRHSRETVQERLTRRGGWVPMKDEGGRERGDMGGGG